MSLQLLNNARIVLRDDVVTGTLVFNEAGIQDIATVEVARGGDVHDCAGDYVLPGLVEMHTDNVERHLEPRPGVVWPSPLSALLAHDALMAAAGVTTVLDAISVGDYRDGGKRRQLLGGTMQALREGREQDLFRAEHLIHLRCEVADRGVVKMFDEYADDPLVRLISLMDHTPGQRQWHDLSKMREFHSRRRTYSDDEFEAMVRERKEDQATFAGVNRQAVLERWRPRGLPIASHDDTTVEHVDEGLADGVRISEFPTTMDAAVRAHDSGMANVMGAPNLVRGGSHSGNVSAGELADAGILDVLSSDYMPASLLHGAFVLHTNHGYTLPDAVACVSDNPARMLGLDDRGHIAVGKRADVIRVRSLEDGSAAVISAWRSGKRVC